MQKDYRARYWVQRRLVGPNLTSPAHLSDAKFGPTGPALGLILDPAGLLPQLKASCLDNAGLSTNSLMLNGYEYEHTAGLDAGLQI